MFWDMWKNLTSVTTNWTFGGGSGGGCTGGGGCGHGSRKCKGQSNPAQYNRLKSSHRPVKSRSHPANLITLATAEAAASSSSYSSASSLESFSTKVSSSPTPKQTISKTDVVAPTEVNSGKGDGLCNKSSRWTRKGVKHSVSATFSPTPENFSTPLPETTKYQNSGSNSSSATDTLANANPLLSHNGRIFQTNRVFDDINRNVTNINVDNGQRSTWNNASRSDTVLDLMEQLDNDDDYDDNDDHLICEVCDRAFPTPRKLAEHQRKKRHYGCLQCDSIFPSREILECHREQMGHYDYDHYFYEGDEDEVSDSDSFETDDDENGLGDYSEECDDEERERLL